MRRRTGIALLLLAAACRRETVPPPAPWRPAAVAAPPSALVDRQGISHSGVLVPAGASFDWELPGHRRGRLRFSWSSPQRRGDVALSVELLPEPGAARGRPVARRIRSFPAAPAAAAVWNEDIELEARGGRPKLRLRLDPPGPLFLSDLRVVEPGPASPAVVLVVFDTTRRDAVGFGGCPDPSTPNLDGILRGAWKAERAYAAASWTIPSVASLLTGRVPAAHEDADGSPLGIVPGVPTLAEDFRRAGWSTAAFVANPTLRAENGFAEGFTTYFTTPNEGASITLPGRETIKRVPEWLAAHRGEPFFLWIHLMDPHDPYTPFDRPRGATPFDPGYRGPIVGDEVNRLQLGDPPVPSPADVRHLEALYHDEVRLDDLEIGRLWRETPEPERSRWTFVFTSDHGEEFGEHGGWKHGPALFDEVLRVPLAIRPGAGARTLAAPASALVSLLDVLPTLEELSGLARPGRALDGSSLLDPSSWSRPSLPPVTMLTGGAPRAALVRRAGKLVFFDRLGSRGIPDPVKDPPGYRLARRLPGILPGIGRFDLAGDPGERRLLPLDRASFPEDWRAVERAIAHTRRGIELRVVGGGAASALELTVSGFGGEASIEPFALDESDRVTFAGPASDRTLDAHLDLSDGVGGLLVEDVSGPDLRITVSGGCAQLRLAGARPVALETGRPQAVPRAAVPETIPLFETPDGCAGVFLWKAAGRPRVRTAAEAEEAWKKLRALGYLH
jgi:arylsulfatase A-like enzyme